MTRSKELKAGDFVEIRSKEEILSTLDEAGQLDGLPFMPQMFNYCGQRFTVFKRAHKTCDTVFPVRGRRMVDAVHLKIRCDGLAYGGCQAGCLIFWKQAWVKKVVDDDAPYEPRPSRNSCNEKDVWSGTRGKAQENLEEPIFVCQATRLPYATSDLKWWHVGQYIEDFLSGNVGIWRILNGAIYSAYSHLAAAGLGLGGIMCWFNDRCHPLWGGTTWPRRSGTIPVGQPTPKPAKPLDLQPGDLVRVKSHNEILKTLNVENKNQGLYFDAEMVPYCGRTFRVLKRVNKILDEKTGKMLTMKTPSIVLEGAICDSRYSHCRMFCPRAIHSYWREIWVERVPDFNRLSAAPTGPQIHGIESHQAVLTRFPSP